MFSHSNYEQNWSQSNNDQVGTQQGLMGGSHFPLSSLKNLTVASLFLLLSLLSSYQPTYIYLSPPLLAFPPFPAHGSLYQEKLWPSYVAPVTRPGPVTQ